MNTSPGSVSYTHLLVAGNFKRFGKSHDRRNVFRAAALAAFLAAAVDQTLDDNAALDIQRTYAFGGAEFMSGKRKHVHV